MTAPACLGRIFKVRLVQRGCSWIPCVSKTPGSKTDELKAQPLTQNETLLSPAAKGDVVIMFLIVSLCVFVCLLVKSHKTTCRLFTETLKKESLDLRPQPINI